MKKLILFLSLFVMFSNIRANTPKVQLVEQMQLFLTNTLKQNYGEHSTQRLFQMFLESYRENRDYVLSIDRKEFSKLNNQILNDSVYSKLYCEVKFVSSVDSLLIVRNLHTNEGNKQTVVNYSTKGEGVSKFNTYCNLQYLKNRIFTNTSESRIIDIIGNFSELSSGSKQNMPFLTNVASKFPKELDLPVVQEYITVVFWNYLCQCSNYDLHKRKKTGKYDLY